MRLATATLFFVNGALFANWVTRVPDVRDRVDAGAGELGLALLGIAIGAMLAMPAAGSACARWGARRVAIGAGLASCLGAPLPALAGDLTQLWAALIAVGAAFGSLDVAMNVEAISVERAYRRPIMPSFHGWFSVGGFVGAIAGGLVASLGVGPGRHLAGAAAVGVACVLWAARGLPAAPAQAPRPRRGPERRLDVTRLLLLCGLIAFCAALIEGAIADWSALYMTDALHAGAGLAAAGYAAFACAMAVGRFSGERLIGAIGASGVLQLGCGGAAIALATGLAAADQAAAVAAFAIVGLGVACVFPIVLGAAGRGEATRSGPAVAFVSVVGYTGFLAGPPLIGVIAEHTTLPWALGVVALHAGIAAVLASRLRSMSARSQSREAVGGSTGSRYLRGGVGNPVIGGQHDDQPGVAWMDADRAGGRV